MSVCAGNINKYKFYFVLNNLILNTDSMTKKNNCLFAKFQWPIRNLEVYKQNIILNLKYTFNNMLIYLYVLNINFKLF